MKKKKKEQLLWQWGDPLDGLEMRSEAKQSLPDVINLPEQLREDLDLTMWVKVMDAFNDSQVENPGARTQIVKLRDQFLVEMDMFLLGRFIQRKDTAFTALDGTQSTVKAMFLEKFAHALARIDADIIMHNEGGWQTNRFFFFLRVCIT